MLLFFFFKQKTAYEMLRSLVGSEMCIRDSREIYLAGRSVIELNPLVAAAGRARRPVPGGWFCRPGHAQAHARGNGPVS